MICKESNLCDRFQHRAAVLTDGRTDRRTEPVTTPLFTGCERKPSLRLTFADGSGVKIGLTSSSTADKVG